MVLMDRLSVSSTCSRVRIERGVKNANLHMFGLRILHVQRTRGGRGVVCRLVSSPITAREKYSTTRTNDQTTKEPTNITVQPWKKKDQRQLLPPSMFCLQANKPFRCLRKNVRKSSTSRLQIQSPYWTKRRPKSGKF